MKYHFLISFFLLFFFPSSLQRPYWCFGRCAGIGSSLKLMGVAQKQELIGLNLDDTELGLLSDVHWDMLLMSC